VLFSYAKTEEWIASNPIEYVKAQKVEPKQPGILDLFQVRALLAACIKLEPDFVPAVTIALFGGVRPESELWHLERRHIDLKKAEIDIHKSPRDRLGSRRSKKISSPGSGIIYRRSRDRSLRVVTPTIPGCNRSAKKLESRFGPRTF